MFDQPEKMQLMQTCNKLSKLFCSFSWLLNRFLLVNLIPKDLVSGDCKFFTERLEKLNDPDDDDNNSNNNNNKNNINNNNDNNNNNNNEIIIVTTITKNICAGVLFLAKLLAVGCNSIQALGSVFSWIFS